MRRRPASVVAVRRGVVERGRHHHAALAALERDPRAVAGLAAPQLVRRGSRCRASRSRRPRRSGRRRGSRPGPALDRSTTSVTTGAGAASSRAATPSAPWVALPVSASWVATSPAMSAGIADARGAPAPVIARIPTMWPRPSTSAPPRASSDTAVLVVISPAVRDAVGVLGPAARRGHDAARDPRPVRAVPADRDHPVAGVHVARARRASPAASARPGTSRSTSPVTGSAARTRRRVLGGRARPTTVDRRRAVGGVDDVAVVSELVRTDDDARARGARRPPAVAAIAGDRRARPGAAIAAASVESGIDVVPAACRRLACRRRPTAARTSTVARAPMAPAVDREGGLASPAAAPRRRRRRRRRRSPRGPRRARTGGSRGGRAGAAGAGAARRRPRTRAFRGSVPTASPRQSPRARGPGAARSGGGPSLQ